MMADVITGAQLDNTRQELIASLVQKELEFKSVLLGLVRDVSGFAVAGSKSISFPKLDSFTAANRAAGTAGSAAALTSTLDTMLLDQSPYVAYIIDKITAIQSNIVTDTEFAQRAGSAMARFIDNYIVSLIEGGAGLSINAAVPADITKSNILSMMEYIEKNEGMLEDTVLVIPADQRAVMLNISEFSANDVYGSPVIRTGQLGMVYGVPVISSNALKAQQAFMFEKSAVVHGFQAPVAFNSEDANTYGVGAKRWAYDAISGGMVTQQAQKGAAAGKSPLVTILTD